MRRLAAVALTAFLLGGLISPVLGVGLAPVVLQPGESITITAAAASAAPTASPSASLAPTPSPTVAPTPTLAPTPTAVPSTAGLFNAHDYGAVCNGTTDDTVALQATLTAAFEAPGGTMSVPVGTCLTSAALVPPAVAGAVRIVGTGRPRSFSGGNSGDPLAAQGSTIRSTGSGDVLKFATTGRQSITIESLAIEGNIGGHGLHFIATGTAAIVVALRDVSVMDAGQHGIFFDGAVFESQMFNVRSDHNGGAGFKAAANSGGLPGEVRVFGSTFDDNDIGLDLSGGGNFSLHGVTASYNTNDGIKATGVGLRAYEFQLEVNGNPATLANLQAPVLSGVVVGVKPGATGIGLSFMGTRGAIVTSFTTNSSVAGAGYRDFAFDDSTSGSEVTGYMPDDGTDRFSLGSLGGHVVRRGATWQTSQQHGQQVVSSAVSGTDAFDATRYDSFLSTRTAPGITRTIRWPTPFNNAYHNGQRVTIEVYNASTGATATVWNSVFHLAGAWVDPSAGKTRTITFEWNNVRGGFFELSRSAADIT